ncbi:MAG TPA: MAPEG family protein [Allosphingosinicella sp.]|nr:MAPEG family protein [Allosphingosinicella sp.]
MTTELSVLAWGCVLGLIHIFAAVRVKTRQYGTKWNTGARDEVLPPSEPLVGRLARAQANYFETFPVMAAAILVVTAAGLETRWTAIGALVWLAARIVYLPLYAMGVPMLRTLVFGISVAGIVMVLWPALAALFQAQ